MHTILFNESFSFCSRDDLERLQPISQSLLDMVVAGSNVLPLRPVHQVNMDYDEGNHTIQIFVNYDDNKPLPDYKASVLDGNFAETLRRLQNTCVKEFWIGIRDSPFLRYWKEQDAATFTVARIEFEPPEATQNDLLDSIVNLLRPRSAEFFVNESSWLDNDHNISKVKLELVARDSFLNNLQICSLHFPPSSFFLDEPGYRKYELLGYHFNLADGIDGLIESFIRDGCANKKLESVCVKWYEWNKHDTTPMPKQLKKPTKIDMPLPKNRMTELIPNSIHRVTQCEMYAFDNKMQWKRMEVYKWTVELGDEYPRRKTHILYCHVKNL